MARTKLRPAITENVEKYCSKQQSYEAFDDEQRRLWDTIATNERLHWMVLALMRGDTAEYIALAEGRMSPPRG